MRLLHLPTPTSSYRTEAVRYLDPNMAPTAPVVPPNLSRYDWRPNGSYIDSPQNPYSNRCRPVFGTDINRFCGERPPHQRPRGLNMVEQHPRTLQQSPPCQIHQNTQHITELGYLKSHVFPKQSVHTRGLIRYSGGLDARLIDVLICAFGSQ